MIRQRPLRIVEIIVVVLLFASAWLWILHVPLAKGMNIGLSIFLCITYLLYHPVYFLDESSKYLPAKRTTRKKFGFGVTLYSQLAAFTCCLICLYGSRMMLMPGFYLFEVIVILIFFLGLFL